MSLTLTSTTPGGPPNGTKVAFDVVGTAAAPAAGDGFEYVKLDVGVAGASSPVTSANPLPSSDATAQSTLATLNAKTSSFLLAVAQQRGFILSTGKVSLAAAGNFRIRLRNTSSTKNGYIQGRGLGALLAHTVPAGVQLPPARVRRERPPEEALEFRILGKARGRLELTSSAEARAHTSGWGFDFLELRSEGGGAVSWEDNTDVEVACLMMMMDVAA